MAERGTLETIDRNAVLLDLVRCQRDHTLSFASFGTLACESGARALGVRRASLWVLEDAGLRCLCIEGDERDQRDVGRVLAPEVCATYFEALQQQRVQAFPAASSDPRTHELADYLRERDIRSLLDAPVFIADRFRAVLCFEHCGFERVFSARDEAFAASLADLVALALAAEERSQTARKLRESELLYRSIVEDQTDFVLRTRIDGSILFANRAACDFFNVPAAAAPGRSTFEFVPEKARAVVSEHVARLSPDRPVTRYEHPVSASGRPDCTVSWVLRGFFDEGGELRELQAIGRDVTHERQHEAQLREAQRLQSLAVLAGGIAHDFNNLLTPIQGFAETMLRAPKDDERNEERLCSILQAAERASQLVRQILIFSRNEDGRRVRLEVAPQLRETMSFMRASLPARIELELALEGDCGAILAQPSDIYQILSNLCTNAFQAMPAGGRLQVSASQIMHANLGRTLQIIVSDTGHGIDPAIQERIFEPFFTTKAPGQGTGLGLSVVHGIVTTLGGTIDIKSERGKGTSFVVLIPSVLSEDEATRALSSGSGGNGQSVLFVDDEPGVGAFGRDSLESAGYRVTTCSSANEALVLFERDPAQFDVVVTDLTMPYMGGIELAWRVHQVRRDVPIVLMSGFGQLLDRADWESAGIVSLLSKPFHTDRLLFAVHEALGGRLAGS